MCRTCFWAAAGAAARRSPTIAASRILVPFRGMIPPVFMYPVIGTAIRPPLSEAFPDPTAASSIVLFRRPDGERAGGAFGSVDLCYRTGASPNRRAAQPRVIFPQVPPRHFRVLARSRDGRAVVCARPLSAGRRRDADDFGAEADRALWRRVYADCRGRVPRDRALPGHLALRLAAGSVQYRARRGADRARLSAGNVPVHAARYAAAVVFADQLAGAGRAARRSAPVLPLVQGPPPGSSVRARPRCERSGFVDQHKGRRGYVHP